MRDLVVFDRIRTADAHHRRGLATAVMRTLAAQADSGFAGVTDEASAMEMAGHRPLLVPGSAQNFKVTYPEDFALAEAILSSRT